ncbi:MAG: DUF2974 domain-containing protein [Oscillospiraceae bacterium]|nr:DUF2974 domain-containing protein [Oscillospiraceae bacterium]
MASMIDYLDWRGDIPFSVDPFNEVDGLLLSQLAYLDLEGIVPPVFSVRVLMRNAYERYCAEREAGILRHVTFQQDLTLFAKLAESRRFSGTQITGYRCAADAEAELQFSAMTYILEDGTALVVYRGTDGSVIGWKEDFNLSFMLQTGAQAEALRYLDENAVRFPKSIRVSGHSKGGNLAVYASAFCRPEVRSRIIQVLSYDGPGFREEIVETPEYRSIVPRVRSFIPESAVIGMLLNNSIDHTIIRCSVSGIMQHFAYNWEVRRKAFCTVRSLSRSGEVINNAISGWISELNDDERKELVDAVFAVFGASEKGTFHEINAHKLSSYPRMLKALSKLSPEQQKLVVEAIGKMAKNSTNALFAEVGVGKKPAPQLKPVEEG